MARYFDICSRILTDGLEARWDNLSNLLSRSVIHHPEYTIIWSYNLRIHLQWYYHWMDSTLYQKLVYYGLKPINQWLCYSKLVSNIIGYGCYWKISIQVVLFFLTFDAWCPTRPVSLSGKTMKLPPPPTSTTTAMNFGLIAQRFESWVLFVIFTFS